jgi:hypothetical protein
MNQNNGNGTNRPKVELGLNEEARLKLLKDKCYEGNNSFGNFYLYSVEHDGQEKAFFATADVHQHILEVGLRCADQFLIKKVAVQDGRNVTSKIVFEVLKKADPVPVDKPANGDGFKILMQRCVHDAVDIVKEVNTIPWQNEDVRSIALTIFIQRARA